MIKDLDFTGIDLVVTKAQLRLEELKAEFVVKLEPEVIRVRVPCESCASRRNMEAMGSRDIAVLEALALREARRRVAFAAQGGSTFERMRPGNPFAGLLE